MIQLVESGLLLQLGLRHIHLMGKDAVVALVPDIEFLPLDVGRIFHGIPRGSCIRGISLRNPGIAPRHAAGGQELLRLRLQKILHYAAQVLRLPGGLLHGLQRLLPVFLKFFLHPENLLFLLPYGLLQGAAVTQCQGSSLFHPFPGIRAETVENNARAKGIFLRIGIHRGGIYIGVIEITAGGCLPSRGIPHRIQKDDLLPFIGGLRAASAQCRSQNQYQTNDSSAVPHLKITFSLSSRPFVISTVSSPKSPVSTHLTSRTPLSPTT